MATGGQPALPQLTPNTSALQKEMVALMQRVQTIDRNWKSQEQKLQLDKEKQAIEHEAQQQDLQNQREYMEEDIKAQEDRLKWVKQDLAKKEEKINEARTKGREIAGRQNPITVEIGGEKFRTQVQTLVQHEGSIFPDLLRALQEHSPRKGHGQSNSNPTIFIDRDGKHFKFILNFMRQGEEVMRGTALKNVDDYTLNEMLFEVRYYKLSDLERLLERRRVIINCNKPKDLSALVKEGWFTTQVQPPSVQPPPFKYKTAREVAIRNGNLSNIVFDRVLFDQKVSFEGCVLARATFQDCAFRAAVSFKNVDLFEAKFIHCSGIELSKRFYLKDTNMKSVQFTPPLQDDS